MLDPLIDLPFHSEMVLKILSRTLHVDSAHLVQFNFIRKNIIMALLTRDRDGRRIFGEWSDIEGWFWYHLFKVKFNHSWTYESWVKHVG